MRERKVQEIVQPYRVREGAGVFVQRTIGGPLNYLDPFLLLDHFHNARPEDYEAGFPMHPHRGIETVTYVLSGSVHHRDTLGNAGSIGPGDVQWMSSGRGIMHEEMPQVRPEGIHGFQLWVNLPAKSKMSKPNYQEVQKITIPQFTTPEGADIRVIAGSVGDVTGPVADIAANPTYMDVFVPAQTQFQFPVPEDHNVFAYLFEGTASFGPSADEITAPMLVTFGEGDTVTVRTKDQSARFIMASGKPLNESVARYGPFVMNTRAEIEQALEDLRRGTFVQPA
jgi:redox-sensitive bicupin YhaK (pirin superfamily)